MTYMQIASPYICNSINHKVIDEDVREKNWADVHDRNILNPKLKLV